MSYAKRMSVTPALAAEWLGNNPSNRKVATAHVQFLAREIKAGRWQDNGATIRRSNTGKLLDGQHRLLAVIAADMSVEMWVIQDLPDSAFKTIDTNAIPRTTAQVFTLEGRANATSQAAIAKATREVLNRWAGESYGGRVSAEELGQFLDSHPCMLQYIEEYTRVNGPARITTASVVGGIVAVAIKTGRHQELLEFLRNVHDGTGLEHGMPAYMLRQRLLEGMGSRRKRYDQTYLAALAIKAAQAYIRRDRMLVLRWSVKEDFPTLEAA